MTSASSSRSQPISKQAPAGEVPAGVSLAPARRDGTVNENRDGVAADSELVAAAVRLAELDRAEFRAEGPRSDAKLSTLISLLVGLSGAVAAGSSVGTRLARDAGSTLAAVLFGAAGLVLLIGLGMVWHVVLPRLHPDGRGGRGGPMAAVADLPDAAAARDYYLAAARDPLLYQAGGAHHHARAIGARYRRIRRPGRVLLAGFALAAAGGLALAWRL